MTQRPASNVISDPANWATGLDASAGLPAGIPAPAELARLANEMFNALPEELQLPAAKAAAAVLPPNSAFTGNPYAGVPSSNSARGSRTVGWFDGSNSPERSQPLQTATLFRTCALLLSLYRTRQYRAVRDRVWYDPYAANRSHFSRRRGRSSLRLMLSLRPKYAFAQFGSPSS